MGSVGSATKTQASLQLEEMPGEYATGTPKKTHDCALPVISSPPQQPKEKKLPSERVKVIAKKAMAAGSHSRAGAIALKVLAFTLGIFAVIGKVLDVPGKLVQTAAKHVGRPIVYDGLGDKLFRGVAALRMEAAKMEGSTAISKALKNASKASAHFNRNETLGHQADLVAAKKPETNHAQLATQLAATDPALGAFVLARGELRETSSALKKMSTDPEVRAMLDGGRAGFKAGDGVAVASVPRDIELHSTKEGLRSRVHELKNKKGEFKETFTEAGLSAMNAREQLTDLPRLGPSDQSWKCYAATSERTDQGTAILARGDSVCPTSSRTKFEVAGLHNAYVNVVEVPGGSKQMNITTGVIDTKAKADAFVAIILQAREDNGLENQPLRIGMHQLNSFIAETPLIECEHAMSCYIQASLREATGDDTIVVSHENTSFNAATKYPIREEARCNSMNLEAAASSVMMLHEDLGEIAGLPLDRLQVLSEALNQVQSAYIQAMDYDPTDYPQLGSLENGIRDLETELRAVNESMERLDPTDLDFQVAVKQQAQLETDIQVLVQTKALAEQTIISTRIGVMSAPSSARETLSGELTQIYSSLGDQMKEVKEKLSKATGKEAESLSHQYTQLASVHSKVGVACGKTKMSQPAKVLMQHLADVSLGMVSQANCKSGLDRTGMARAMIASVDTMIKDGVPLDKVVDFAAHIDEHIQALNKALDAQVTKATTGAELKEFVSNLNPQELQWAFKFQMNNFTQLLDVGLAVTARSTGLAGLKWHHEGGASANPHPGPMLPRFVLDSGGSLQRLVNENGLMTKYGTEVLSGGSALRGG